jgi:DNA-binding transcriptional regulator YdaS (Cro superfamily)
LVDAKFSLMDKILAEAVAKAGGFHAVARALKISPQAVAQWRRLPPARVIAFERISGVDRRKLRPDLYPDR